MRRGERIIYTLIIIAFVALFVYFTLPELDNFDSDRDAMRGFMKVPVSKD